MNQYDGTKDRNAAYRQPQHFSETNPHAQPYPQYMPPPAQHARTKKLPWWGWALVVLGALIVVAGIVGPPNDQAQRAGNLPNVVTTPTPIAPRTKEAAPGVPVNPATVRVGQSFVVGGKLVMSGWKLKDSYGYLGMHVKIKNSTDQSDLFTPITFRFIRGDEVVMVATCYSGTLGPDHAGLADCFSTDAYTRDYETIEAS